MEKRFKNGLVLGKFMPPHLGHLHLIDTAIENCEMVTVMVCSLKNEPILGLGRYMWLVEIYIDNDSVDIIHCQDENPQKPEECESTDIFYNNYWVPSVNSRIGNLDVVFTSEEYGDEFAKYLGIEHFLVDIDRKKFPISGTEVRNNPYKNWDFIPNEIKNYYTKRVVIMGPESTGKSMLTKELADHYKVAYVEEYGREYTTDVKAPKELEVDDFYTIAKGHDDIIFDKLVETTDKLLIVDTEAITTKLFGELYIDGFKDDRLEDIIKYQKFDLYLLLDIDVPWVDDGTRDFPHLREKHMGMLKKELEGKGIEYQLITGDYKERLIKSIQIIDDLIGVNG